MCGIFGVIHNKKMKLNKSHFNALGVINDTRGGDSCGIALDTNIEYGVDKEKLYSSFFHVSDVLKKVNYCDFAFGHCRKASVGGISLETAQPVVIKEGDVVKFILIHNGTICNYASLAAKYVPECDIKGMTDSQVMAQIFYHTGFKVLTEYIGAGAFVMADYRTETGTPIVRMFKGSSKLSEHSKDSSEERPLFMTKEGSSMWFSSIFPMLAALRVGTDVYTVTPNTLYTIEKAHIIKRELYDRTSQTQTFPKTYYGNSFYNDDDDFYKNRYSSRVSQIANSDSWIIDPYVMRDKVQYRADGLFYVNEKPAQGILNITCMGNIVDVKYSYAVTHLVPIFQGVLLTNMEAYRLLEEICEGYAMSPEELIVSFPEVVWKYSYLPEVSKDNTGYKFTQHLLAGEFCFVGNLPILFNFYPQVFCIKGGRVTRKVSLEGTNAATELFKSYCAVLDENDFNYKKEYKRIIKKVDKICQEYQNKK